VKGMWFAVPERPVFAVAEFWQQTVKEPDFTIVTCDPNELVAPIHPKVRTGRRRPWDQGFSSTSRQSHITGSGWPASNAVEVAIWQLRGSTRMARNDRT